ncbi:MAG: hypothetical protein HYZ29_34035 [Myxococcales bacterium]|nr:hypothetical protein [Myxococcales bacterium]
MFVRFTKDFSAGEAFAGKSSVLSYAKLASTPPPGIFRYGSTWNHDEIPVVGQHSVSPDSIVMAGNTTAHSVRFSRVSRLGVFNVVNEQVYNAPVGVQVLQAVAGQLGSRDLVAWVEYSYPEHGPRS